MGGWWPVLACLGFVYVIWQASGFSDRGIKEEQAQFDAGQDYDPRRVRLATVQARQDIVLLCYLMYWVVGLLFVLAALVGTYVMHHW